MPSVLQPWVNDLSFMMQSVLTSAIRGPDGMPKYTPAKMLLRWYRRCVMIDAFSGDIITSPLTDNGASFTGPSVMGCGHFGFWEPRMKEVLDGYMQSMDQLPYHYINHFRHACEILGYKHPDDAIRAWWLHLYQRQVRELHLYPESEEQLNHRLGDSKANWLDGADPATTA
jgi:hypothetical protein